MTEIINWCNTNEGFMTACLSLIGLLLSLIAIAVSIATARLPYKKKIKLASSINILFAKNPLTNETTSEIAGISVNAANVGHRNVNLSYLGIVVRDMSLDGGQQKMSKIKREITGVGLLSPSEVKTELYNKRDLLYTISQVDSSAKVFLYARDTEGTEYYKGIGRVDTMKKNLGA